jgi:MFS family permease
MSVPRTTRSLRHRGQALLATVRANPTLLAVWAEGFLTRAGYSMVGFALPLYALSLGMGMAEIGLLYALRTVVTILVKPATGWAADRFGPKPTLVTAVALRCLVCLLFGFASAPWHLYAIRVLNGAATAAREPTALALIARHGHRERMASAFAAYITARNLGRAIGYAAAGVLIQAAGYFTIFAIAFVTSCAALVTVLRYVASGREGLDRSPAPVGPPPAPARAWTLYRGLLGYAGFGLTIAASAEMMRGLFPVIATVYGHLTEAQSGLIMSIAMLASLVAAPIFAWASDRFSRKVALAARGVANTVSSLLYIIVPTFSGFLAARVIDETGKAAFNPTWAALLAEAAEADPERQARIMTFGDSAYTLGEILGPLLAGALMAGFGVPVMLGTRAVLALATEIQAVLVFRKRRKPESGAPVPEDSPGAKPLAPSRGAPAGAELSHGRLPARAGAGPPLTLCASSDMLERTSPSQEEQS